MPFPTVVMPVPQFSISVVHRELSSLDITTGAGPDDIHPQMVRWLADFFSEPLSKLFANSQTTAVVPIDWRLAIKCPINKKAIQRTLKPPPLSVTSIICKIFEMILKKALPSFHYDTRSI